MPRPYSPRGIQQAAFNNKEHEPMTRIVILSASLLAATCGQAFAYSNVSPQAVSQVKASDQQEPGSFFRFDRANTVDSDSYRYHGGPKAND
jgi:hypothetical protein